MIAEISNPPVSWKLQSEESLTPAYVRWLDEQFGQMTTEEVLAWAWKRFGARAAVGTSFQGAGLVMLHLELELKQD